MTQQPQPPQEDQELEVADPIVMFSEWLADEYKRGGIDEELTSKFAELVSTIEQLGGSGSLTLTFKVKKDGARAITVQEKIDVKLPPEPRGQAIFFPDARGNLFRDDPYATKIQFPDK